MENIRDEDKEYEEELDNEEIETQENLRTLDNEELVRLCSGFARENMKLIHWLYKYHKDILRDYEKRYLGGRHIKFT